MIQLDRATHTYSNRLPSVTTILKSAGLIDDAFYTEEGRERGSAVHLACEYFDQGDLDEESIDPKIEGYLKSYKLFRSLQVQVSPEWIEIPMQDKCGVYAGTPDRVLAVRPRAIWDIKTGPDQPSHKWQLAAYVNMLDDPFSYRRYGVYLKKNGSLPKILEFPRTEYISDLSVFMAALTIHNAKIQNRIN